MLHRKLLGPTVGGLIIFGCRVASAACSGSTIGMPTTAPPTSPGCWPIVTPATGDYLLNWRPGAFQNPSAQSLVAIPLPLTAVTGAAGSGNNTNITGMSSLSTLTNVSPLTMSGPLVLPSVNPSYLFMPQGNAGDTYGSAVIQGATGNTTYRNYELTVGLDATGAAGTGGLEGNVALYTGITCEATDSGNCWSYNPLATFAAGYTGGGGYVMEVDLNNNAYHSVIADAHIGAVLITAASQYRSAYGIAIDGAATPSDGAAFDVGVIVDTAATANYSSAGTAVTGYYDEGVHTYILDFAAATGVVRFGNDQALVFRNYTITNADIPFALLDTNNNLQIATAGAGGVQSPLVNFNSPITMSGTLPTGTASTYACWTADHELISSDTAC